MGILFNTPIYVFFFEDRGLTQQLIEDNKCSYGSAGFWPFAET